jgi:hypothetical protein
MPDEPVSPSAIEPDLATYVDFLTEVAETRGNPLKMAEEMEELSRYYRALGICRLAGEADVDGFFHYLIQSALVRRHYLQAARADGGGEPNYRRASMLEPVFDAMAARQWRLAGAIFDLVSHEWSEGEEYEDDYCYADFVRRSLSEPAADLVTILERWARILDGASEPRLDVARSLVARDPEAFDTALRALLASDDGKMRAMADPVDGSVLADELPFFPNRWVSVEALALLALAARQQVEVPGLFPACPPLVRAGVFGSFSTRGFPHIHYVNE